MENIEIFAILIWCCVMFMWGYLYSREILLIRMYCFSQLTNHFLGWLTVGLIFSTTGKIASYEAILYAIFYSLGFYFWVRRFKTSPVPPNG
jgi:hypothetical protein